MRFDENLRNLRKEKDYSQEYLAEKLGVTRQTISKWENGTAMPDLKKLIELADFFETSMDDLLGLDYKTSNPKQNFTKGACNDYNEAEAILANRYTNDLIHTVSNRIHSKTKALSIWLTLIAIVLAITIISLSGTISSLRTDISNLSISVFDLQQMNPSSSDNYDDNYYDVEVNVLKVYPETPHIAQFEFKFAPSSYPKNSKIYYLVPKKDGGVDRLEAKDNNGEFVLKADVDLSVNSPCYFVLDDGENIVKQEISASVEDVYGACGDDIYYDIDKSMNSNAYHFSSGEVNIDYVISWWYSEKIWAASADIVVENGGKEVFRQAMQNNSEQGDCAQFSMPEFDVENITLTSPDVYMEIKFNNGVKARRHFENSWAKVGFETDSSSEIESMHSSDYYSEYI
ncbi:MAG: helix-turn-helix domain-containing protein, partial [Eubacterium sp.]|nr:helix-turn-helix domain-containing protein [Eubacterium sp.]